MNGRLITVSSFSNDIKHVPLLFLLEIPDDEATYVHFMFNVHKQIASKDISHKPTYNINKNIRYSSLPMFFATYFC